MGGRISALEIQKKNKQRVNVYLDGEFAFSLALDVALHLKQGQWLEDADIDALKAQDAYYRALDAAIRLLAVRPRSIAELRQRLRRRGFDAGTIDRVLARLQELEYVDDEAFARYWVENRERFRPRGPHALRYELFQKGVPADVVDRVLADVDPTASALKALQARARRWQHLDEETFRRKAGQFLARRGFSYDIIQDVVTTVWEELQNQAKSTPDTYP